MLKISPQIRAILKSFVRNRTYMLLLIVAPLILISAIFISFNPRGIQQMPVGIIGESASFNITQYNDKYFPYLEMTRFGSIEDCIAGIRDYEQYMCIELSERDRVVLHIYYDNTRPAIWEIIEKIKTSVDYLQKQQSKKIASGFLEKVHSTNSRMERFEGSLNTTNSQIDLYIIEIDKTIDDLEIARQELNTTLGSMDQNVIATRQDAQQMEEDKQELYTNSISRIGEIEDHADNYPENDTDAERILSRTRELKKKIDAYNDDADDLFETIDMQLYGYGIASARGREYIAQIDDSIDALERSRDQLTIYKKNISQTNDELSSISGELDDLEILKADNLVSPVVIRGSPTYIADPDGVLKNQTDQAGILRGINMISLQTIYPTVLFLILLFLSLLISSFVTLSEINSAAHTRVSLVKRPSVHEPISIFLASLIIIFIPIGLILLMGSMLFHIDILGHIGPVLGIIILTISIFILFGMTLAYLIRKESITLLLTTFILVLLIFFSGAIMPVERMSPISKAVAANTPSHLGLLAFNRVVFYDQSLSSIAGYMILMLIYAAVFSSALLLIKKYYRIG